MASLLCNRGSIIVTSGLKFKVIQPHFFENGTLEGVERKLPEALPAKKCEEGEDPTAKAKTDTIQGSQTICGGCVSTDGRLMALCDDRKQLTLWNCEDWSLLKQWTLQRRANKVAFNSDLSKVLIADKGGDLFVFDDSGEGVCILGHLSMLLDLTLSSCGNYLITCDRDEKIRVSHYPNSYNIHNFCLGHTEFVSAMALCPHNTSLLCSTSGDGTLKIWEFLTGLQIDSRLCSQDVTVSSAPENEIFNIPPPIKNGAVTAAKNGTGAVRVQRNPVPAVKSLRVAKISEDTSLIVVTIERFEGLLAYLVSSPGNKLTFIQSIATEQPVWDFGFDTVSGDLIVLLTSNDDYLLRYTVAADGLTQLPVPRTPLSQSELNQFFEAAKSCPRSRVEDLYKKSFDNMPEYMERKENRIIKKENKTLKAKTDSEPEAKKIKL